MKANIGILDEVSMLGEHFYRVFEALLNYFKYAISDVESYDKLTDEEKQIISEEMWDRLTIKTTSNLLSK